ncbi:MAG: class I SAM-dependent methyltransferase [Candidatus Taylorbacteria bacterium]|nr:class I SAM-dependent methyltransferase [Candidatus Taylorbacteria bacterium]
MSTHLDHLKEWRPGILKDKILDLGSGRGSFLIDVKKQGGNAIGIETSQNYIELSHAGAKEAGVEIEVKAAVGEHLPFENDQFDFINMAEVIEHVENPATVLAETYRVLSNNGAVYMSVPNRFGMRDQHYGIYGINWMPRSLAMRLLTVFRAHKDYSTENEIGCQRLDSMHYFTLRAIVKLCQKSGFECSDIRLQKILAGKQPSLKSKLLSLIYRFARLFYFDSFHLKLSKNPRSQAN